MDEFERATKFEANHPIASPDESKLLKSALKNPMVSLSRSRSHSTELTFQQKIEHREVARRVSNPETLIDHSDTKRASKTTHRRDTVGTASIVERKPDFAQDLNDKIELNNLMLSIGSFVSRDLVLEHYWDLDAIRMTVTGRHVDDAKRVRMLRVILQRYAKAAYLLHGCKVNMNVLSDWFPMVLWTDNLSKEEIEQITSEVEKETTETLSANIEVVVKEMMEDPGFPALPNTVTHLTQMATDSKSHARRVKFKQLVEGYDEKAYEWIESTLQIFSDILPLREILSDEGPLNLIRKHLITVTVAWASIHYETVLLKAAFDRLQKEHDAECEALASQGAMARPDAGLVRDSEMLERLRYRDGF